MQDPTLPLVKDIVLIGGGHAHALVLRMWGMRPIPGLRLTLINPGPVAPYTGMLPGHIAGHYRRDEMMIDLVRLARFAGARLILDRATGIDREARRIHLAGRPPVDYDLASLDIGITSDLPALPGAADHAVSAKPLGAYAARWEAFLTTAPEAPAVTVVGAGVGGLELALASAHRLRGLGRRPKVVLLEAGPLALPLLKEGARRRLLSVASAQGVEVLTGARPAEILAGAVRLQDGRLLPSDFTLTVTTARPQPWLEGTGLALDGGFVAVDGFLQSSDPAIFASGDCAHLSRSPRPKAGVFAVRAAPVLAHNLRAALTGGVMRAFSPQGDYLKLVSLGGQQALGEKWGLRAKGTAMWRWKDRIDRKFMAMFQDFPAMPAPALPQGALPEVAEALGEKPLCGGCGAKVGPGALSESLVALPRPQRSDVLAGRGDDAALLVHGGGVQVISTDHLRAFWADPRLMGRIAANHALGDIWAMGAAPQVALAQITLPRLSEALQARTLAEVMEAAGEVFAAAGVDVVGGHTTIGAELTIGFTVTGLASRVVTKGGARPGDALILTKALGSGIVMAAEMALTRLRGPMLGDCVASALAAMQRGQGAASTVLVPHAHAMTDVTGFGLAGHLMEMLEASGCAAELDMGSIPCLPGAVELAAEGVASSIAPANRAAVLGRVTGAPGPATPLLYDPQTGGGLLAAVPAAMAAELVERLRLSDPEAAVIGRVVAGEPCIAC